MTDQWDNIVRRLGDKEGFSIEGFLRTPKYMIYGTFDPKRFGELYLKTLIYSCYHKISDQGRARYHAIKNTRLADPYGIEISGNFITLDYLMAARECEFVEKVMPSVDTVVEIGAGYGRTCHAMLSNFDIENYYIVDLPFSIGISREYLQRALPPEKFSRIKFVTNTDFGKIELVKPKKTLFINIDSMGEMSPPVIDEYLQWIDRSAAYFYCNNTLGKYDPYDIGEVNLRKADLKDAIQSGKMPGTINIFDDGQLIPATSRFLDAYRPSKAWRELAHAFTGFYPHYYQSLYSRES